MKNSLINKKSSIIMINNSMKVDTTLSSRNIKLTKVKRRALISSCDFQIIY